MKLVFMMLLLGVFSFQLQSADKEKGSRKISSMEDSLDAVLGMNEKNSGMGVKISDIDKSATDKLKNKYGPYPGWNPMFPIFRCNASGFNAFGIGESPDRFQAMHIAQMYCFQYGGPMAGCMPGGCMPY